MKFVIAVAVILGGLGIVVTSPLPKDDIIATNPNVEQEETVYESFLKEHEDIQAMSVQVSQILCNDSTTFNRAAAESERRMRSIDLTEGSVCYLIENRLEYVLEPLTEAIDTCDEKNSYGKIALTITRAAASFAKYVCKSKGEEILDVFHSCIPETGLRLYSDEETMRKIEVLADSMFLQSSPDTDVTGIDAVCAIAKEIRNYYSEHMNCCLPSTKKWIVGLIDAIIEPCNQL